MNVYLAWYASKAYECTCTVVHFEAMRRELAPLHNSRAALIAGLSFGMGRPTLLLAEDDYSPPIDYEDHLKVYSSARECQAVIEGWLAEQHLVPTAGVRSQRLKLATELRNLRFGENVAENESDVLSEYFVETASFDDVLSIRDALFVGRKGTGKTANMLQAAARLQGDVRNLVVVIKPASYEFASLLALLGEMSISMRQYAIESMWRFLLHSEIANSAIDAIEARQSYIPLNEEERDLIGFVDENDFGVRDSFGIRFEKTVRALSSVGVDRASLEGEGRDLVNEALHTQAIARLRTLLGRVLKGRRRVAILIDNLDKGWDRAADLDELSQLLLGLLGAIGRVSNDFAREDSSRDRITLTVATFLRSDIFAHLQRVAREPDKLPLSRLEWHDPEILVRIIEERFLAARPEGTDPDELWSRYFCSEVDGVPTKDYLLSRCLHRPRDIIYLCNSVATEAVNRRNNQIEVDDIRAGLVTYSRFAYEALLVENGITISELDAVLLEFAGEPSLLDEDRVRTLIGIAGISEDRTDVVLQRLKAVSFLGIEVADDEFEFSELGPDSDKSRVLARKLATKRNATPRVSVHHAFRPYLEITD